MSCLSTIALTPAPVPVIAQIDFGIFPGETIAIPGLDIPRGPGIVIEIKRKYEDAAPAPGGATSIETFPAKCKLPGK